MKTQLVSTALLAAAACAALSPRAAACGGTFCDSGPQAMPVDQTGENILFVVDGTTVEAHVQIQYQGAAERFAWVVPLPAVPAVSVGSEALFRALLQSTVPSYGFSTIRDTCPSRFCGVGGASGSGGASFASPGAGGGGSSDGGVTVVFRRTVGAFEVTALQGRSAQEVLDWLTANSYQTAALAPTILAGYVAKGSVFLAVKLTAGADANEIHPLVFKFRGPEACVPIELTRVAAVPDMGIRAFFLGDSRVTSTNYRAVTPNLVRLDWLNNGSNYEQLVTAAVDEAGGHAFVTEYAGSSGVVQTSGMVDPAWDESAFLGIAPASVLDELMRQNLVYCPAPGDHCTPQHPLVEPLLADFLPVTVEADGTFSYCPACAAPDATPLAFDSTAFVQALHDRIFEPARHAVALVARWPFLTRLFTTLSPDEMTLDPFFAPTGDQRNVQPMAFSTRRIAQSGASGFQLPDGTEVGLDNGATWPVFGAAMPSAALVADYVQGQPAQIVTDNTVDIQAELDAWNASQGWPAPPPTCPALEPCPRGTGGNASAGAAGSGGASSGSGGTSSGAGGAEGARLRSASGASGGCSIDAGSSSGLGVPLLLSTLGLALARRRRRRAR